MTMLLAQDLSDSREHSYESVSETAVPKPTPETNALFTGTSTLRLFIPNPSTLYDLPSPMLRARRLGTWPLHSQSPARACWGKMGASEID